MTRSTFEHLCTLKPGKHWQCQLVPSWKVELAGDGEDKRIVLRCTHCKHPFQATNLSRPSKTHLLGAGCQTRNFNLKSQRCCSSSSQCWGGGRKRRAAAPTTACATSSAAGAASVNAVHCCMAHSSGPIWTAC
jgi:hypothetical protein